MYHDSLEEEWLYEACAETYIPLLNTLCRLADEGVMPRITVSFSPVLTEQLQLEHFKERFIRYCEEKAEAARRDRHEFEHKDKHLAWLAAKWEEFYTGSLRAFTDRYHKDIPAAFRDLQHHHFIELMTCGATHAYFPAACEDTTIQAQVKMAVASHRRTFDILPAGLWLPECGYRPSCFWSTPMNLRQEAPYPRKGIEEFLSENDLRFFIADNHQLMRAAPPDLMKHCFFAWRAAGAQTPRNPVAVMARDIELSLQVWRHEIGYPGDGAYLEFHKRHGGGRLRYWKITSNKSDLAFKHFYYPDDALNQKIVEHAGHYKLQIANSLKNNFNATGKAAMALTAFDSELYGHWWFEGPTFLYHLIKWIHADPDIRTETISEYISRMPPQGDVYLPESSWGNNFDNSTWINPEVAWVLHREYDAEREMQFLAREFAWREDPELRKILQQCARETMLLLSSDWKFMITNWSTRDHAERRVVEHYNDFKRLARMAWDYGHGRIVEESEWTYLGDVMARDRLFPDIEPRWFAGLDVAPHP